ncbi:MAG: hypothetical protein H6551_04435 [Chitinophagales bacterium]|nr:hypothetical protein [Chitinophagaceae bacterium]MCB9064372.1 hypothetical protein [Chitinophagales bacterium]
MKNLFLFSAITLFAIGITSCKKKSTDNDSATSNTNTIIVDSARLWFHPGLNFGKTVRHYLLTSQEIRIDTATFSNNFAPFHFDRVLSSSAHQQVKGLLSSIPNRIITESGKDFHDAEKCIDGPRTFIEVYIDGTGYNWGLDECYDKLPGYVAPFAKELGSVSDFLEGK